MDRELKPSDYNLPHDSFRKYQRETIEWVQERDGIMLVEQPVGSGKSCVAAA
jgi:type II secretory ATPase GspE/PulE/Tfp pilus assembly ATPase PilB-like protein